MIYEILVPLILIYLIYIGYFLYDLTHVIKTTKYVPKLVWGLVICLSVPLGGLLYYVLGRQLEGEKREKNR
ncbi:MULTISPECIES: hypothetical protein [Lactiplantibacillus]|jgi:hypothetical protein|uniref:Cardiolipin synthase N-terminal domain-containing protein n=2 Tax=Lactiplantibacillus pentosus TaxID=1589 RepID=A0A241RRA6_LACPE|nr:MULTISPECIES: hypothetical protein [Lactiplantibacillus]MCH4128996.1 hypothetical protein [Lactiplantibacillus sp.]BBM22453.1 uncharacterized protein SN13T_2493 [Lactiplantibacillus plantarum]ASG80485.1 hypothetical protein CEW82_11710 [Lactiplantibacillus pentosus]AUI77803.1 hypothetical protein BB562_03370 [Lactiplantibacillus pentosus]AYJ42833.1 hypothetical protein LP314_13580 [Lactiplantibacillus pentosus]